MSDLVRYVHKIEDHHIRMVNGRPKASVMGASDEEMAPVRQYIKKTHENADDDKRHSPRQLSLF